MGDERGTDRGIVFVDEMVLDELDREGAVIRSRSGRQMEPEPEIQKK